MRLDSTTMHSDDIGKVVGKFFDSSIREVDLNAVDLREIRDAQLFARLSLGEEPTKIELLPGETIKNGVIRHTTTSEVRGDEFYAQEIPEGRQIPLHQGLVQSPATGKLITWRPGNENFAVVHEEVAE